MPTAAARQTTGLTGDAVLPIAVHALTANAVLDFDLYIQRNPSESLVLYRSRNTPLEQADLDRLAARGTQTLYIQTLDSGGFQQYLRKEVIENEGLAPNTRYEILRDSTRTVFDTIVRSGDVGRTVDFTTELGAQVADIICHSDLVLDDLLSMMEYDYYTYTHAMSVCTQSVLLAKRIGICDTAELPQLATGGLLHDIGKRQIDSRVLNKPDKLSAKERVVLQQHPKAGFESLCRREDLNWGQLMMVYQHHERLGGQGYPVGVAREDIHSWARACSIVDVFHGITTARPYHDANPFGAALDYLERQAGSVFDADMVSCWTEMTR